MKKLYRLLAPIFIIALISTILVGSAVFASSDDADLASPAPGGDVRCLDDLITALGEENVRKVSGSADTVCLSRNIRLNGTVRIYSGNYRIIGNGSTVYRGDNEYQLFSLYFDALDDSSAPSLTLGKASDEIPDDPENADLIISGARDSRSSAAEGPIFSLIGKVTLNIYPSTVIKDNYTASPGAAVFMQTLVTDTTAYTPLEPTLNISGGWITNNTSTSSGGAIALIGESNGNGSGLVNITSCDISGNTVENESGDGRGGAVYCEGGYLLLTSCTLSSNSADLGGAIYTDHEALLTSCSFTLNEAKKSGGAIYAAQAYDGDTLASTHAALITLASIYITENTSLGDGGAITNNGGKLIFLSDASNYVSKNSSVGDGAAIYNSGTVELASGEFYYNKSTGGRGALYNAQGGVIEYSGGDVRVNTTLSGSGVYNLGSFHMSGGCFQGNICTAKNAPQIANLGEFSLSGGFLIEGDVIGLILPDDGSNASALELLGDLTTNVRINVAFLEELESGDAALVYKYKNSSGMAVYSGRDEFKLSAIERTDVVSPGFGDYTLSDTGELVFRFPIMPLFAWILCTLALIAASVAAVYLVKRHKKRKTQRSEN